MRGEAAVNGYCAALPRLMVIARRCRGYLLIVIGYWGAAKPRLLVICYCAALPRLMGIARRCRGYLLLGSGEAAVQKFDGVTV